MMDLLDDLLDLEENGLDLCEFVDLKDLLRLSEYLHLAIEQRLKYPQVMPFLLLSNINYPAKDLKHCIFILDKIILLGISLLNRSLKEVSEKEPLYFKEDCQFF